MNVLFSSDDNYARHMGVTIYSLLSHNTLASEIRIFVVDNNISSKNIAKLQQIFSGFPNAEMILIPFKKWADNLHLNMSWPISLSSYARLFIGEILPNDINRVIYLDCDMVVNSDLSGLWNTELGDHVVGAVQDRVPYSVKNAVGLFSNDRYFNAGMLLIDLRKWRTLNIGEKCLRFIDSHQGKVIHHDQGVLNGVLKGLWFRLPLIFNVMTIHYMVSQEGIRKYFHDDSDFYTITELEEALNYPVILHYTPSFTTHPWETNCQHPRLGTYVDILSKTPWVGFPLENANNPWYIRLINWYYRHTL